LTLPKYSGTPLIQTNHGARGAPALARVNEVSATEASRV
jgi:hypothetical protein